MVDASYGMREMIGYLAKNGIVKDPRLRIQRLRPLLSTRLENYVKYSFELLNRDVAKQLFKSDWPIYTLPPTIPLRPSMAKSLGHEFVHLEWLLVEGEVHDSIICRNVKIAKARKSRARSSFRTSRSGPMVTLSDVVIDKYSIVTARHTIAGRPGECHLPQTRSYLMKIAMFASEATLWPKSGGLADVVYALSKELAKEGHDVIIGMPYYSVNQSQESQDQESRFLRGLYVLASPRSPIYSYESEGITYYLISNQYYFDRDKLYGYDDDGERFAFLSLGLPSLIEVHRFPSRHRPCPRLADRDDPVPRSKSRTASTISIRR
jgi:hypothetical protein